MLPVRRYSEWLPGGVPPKRPALATVGLVGSCGSFLALMAASTFLPFESLRRFMPIILGVMMGGYVLMCAGIVGNAFQGRKRVPLGEGPSGVPQFPATAILRREVGYGAEEGLLSFVDGWLVFSAKSLSFSVRRNDVELEANPEKLGFVFAGPHGAHRAILAPLGGAGALRAAWAEWFWAGAEPDGAPLYPPILPSPVRRTGPMWRFYVLFMIAMGLLSLRANPIVGVAELLAALAVLYLDLSGRAALRRIEAGEPPRLKGLRGVCWSLRQGEPLQTVVQRALR